MKIEEKQLLGMKLQLLAGDDSQVDNPTEDNEEGDDREPTPKDEKTFTQAELEEILSKRLAKEKKKIEAEKDKAYQAQLEAEIKESERLSQMNEAEKARALAEKREKQLKEKEEALLARERELERANLLNVSKDMLASKNLPVDFSDMILATSKDAEEIKENIIVFEKNFKDAVDKAVSERLRGRTPSAGTTSKTFTYESLKNMSPEEINKNWDKIKNSMR